MRMSEKCHHNIDYLLTSCRTDGGKNAPLDSKIYSVRVKGYPFSDAVFF